MVPGPSNRLVTGARLGVSLSNTRCSWCGVEYSQLVDGSAEHSQGCPMHPRCAIHRSRDVVFFRTTRRTGCRSAQSNVSRVFKVPPLGAFALDVSKAQMEVMCSGRLPTAIDFPRRAHAVKTRAHTQASLAHSADARPCYRQVTEYPKGAVSVLKPTCDASKKREAQGTEETGSDRPAAPISNEQPKVGRSRLLALRVRRGLLCCECDHSGRVRAGIFQQQHSTSSGLSGRASHGLSRCLLDVDPFNAHCWCNRQHLRPNSRWVPFDSVQCAPSQLQRGAA